MERIYASMIRLRTLGLSALLFLAGSTDAVAKSQYSRPSSKAQISSGRVQVLPTYRSPRNRQRPTRKRTQFIILHTTEGSARGALEKLSANGECHYVVTTDGKIYSIIDKTRVAYHAGVSMWNGKTGLDAVSIGIEVVGYHNKDILPAQYKALKALLQEIKTSYRIADENVLTHSMVAYGNPNRWQKRRHRGRKRCGMLMALPTTRAKLGLYKKPAYDPDVKAGRLYDADPELSRILYKQGPVREKEIAVVESVASKMASNVIGPKRSAWDIARDMYRASDTVYYFPDGTKKTGAEIKNWKSMPTGTRVEVGGGTVENPSEGLVTISPNDPASELAGDEVRASSTFYFVPGSGQKFRSGATLTQGAIDALPTGTRMLVGYNVGGPISPRLPVFNICGVRWNRPDTFYLTSGGKLTSGDEINDKNIPAGAMVFYRQ